MFGRAAITLGIGPHSSSNIELVSAFSTISFSVKLERCTSILDRVIAWRCIYDEDGRDVRCRTDVSFSRCSEHVLGPSSISSTFVVRRATSRRYPDVARPRRP